MRPSLQLNGRYLALLVGLLGAGSFLAAEDVLLQQLQALKRKSMIELSLKDGRQIEGMFTSFDDYYQTVWVIPKGKRRFFRDASYRVRDIQSVNVLSEPNQASSSTVSTGSGKPSQPAKPDSSATGYELLGPDSGGN